MPFAVSTSGWLPVLYADGRRVRVGFRTALADAHLIRRIDGGYPLTDVVVTRFLSALLYRITHHAGAPLSTDQEWRALWDRGCLNAQDVDAYVAAWADRWGIDDDVHPFLQDPHLDPPKPPKTVPQLVTRRFDVLDPSWPGATSAFFLSDHDPADNIGVPIEDAPVGLLMAQHYSHGGSTGTETGLLRNKVVALLEQDTLFRTLLLNTPPHPDAGSPDDMPPWESSPGPYDQAGRGLPYAKMVGGPASYLMIPHKRIRLAFDAPTVVAVARSGGPAKAKSFNPTTGDSKNPKPQVTPVEKFNDPHVLFGGNGRPVQPPDAAPLWTEVPTLLALAGRATPLASRSAAANSTATAGALTSLFDAPVEPEQLAFPNFDEHREEGFPAVSGAGEAAAHAPDDHDLILTALKVLAPAKGTVGWVSTTTLRVRQSLIGDPAAFVAISQACRIATTVAGAFTNTNRSPSDLARQLTGLVTDGIAPNRSPKGGLDLGDRFQTITDQVRGLVVPHVTTTYWPALDHPFQRLLTDPTAATADTFVAAVASAALATVDGVFGAMPQTVDTIRLHQGAREAVHGVITYAKKAAA